MISHQSLPNLQNYDTLNTDQALLQNNFDITAQNNWQQNDLQYTQTESQVWQPEQLIQNEYQQEAQLSVQQNGE